MRLTAREPYIEACSRWPLFPRGVGSAGSAVLYRRPSGSSHASAGDRHSTFSSHVMRFLCFGRSAFGADCVGERFIWFPLCRRSSGRHDAAPAVSCPATLSCTIATGLTESIGGRPAVPQISMSPFQLPLRLHGTFSYFGTPWTIRGSCARRVHSRAASASSTTASATGPGRILFPRRTRDPNGSPRRDCSTEEIRAVTKAFGMTDTQVEIDQAEDGTVRRISSYRKEIIQ